MDILRLALGMVAGLLVVGGGGACSVVGPQGTPAVAAPVAVQEQARASAVRIMPLGDSITAGDASGVSYRRELGELLRRDGVGFEFVGSVPDRFGSGDHEGHPGWRIERVAEHVDEWMMASRPDIVLLHIGTNDMRRPELAVGADERLGRLIDRLLAVSPDVIVLVAKISGADDEDAHRKYQRSIDAYNAKVPAVVAQRGERVRLVDQTGVDGDDLLDRLHPNDRGYRKMARNWWKALRLPPAGETVRARAGVAG
jgi:hypothetical protein